MPPTMTCGISTDFSVLSPARGQVAHVLLTRLPLGTPLPCGREALARLACVRRAASVNPEPGSNSPSKDRGPKGLALSLKDSQSLSHSSVVKVLNASSATPQRGLAAATGGAGRALPPPSPPSGRVDSSVGGVTAIVARARHPCNRPALPSPAPEALAGPGRVFT